MRLTRRISEVYRERGVAGVAAQTARKIAYWHRRLSFRPHIIQKTLCGHTFSVAINNLFAQGWVERRERWPELEWLKDNFIEQGDCVVDCGANMGFTTIFFAHFVGPRGKVFAFEPYAPNVADIRQNVLLNSLTNVEIRQAAAGSRARTARLMATSNGTLVAEDLPGVISVDEVRLDDALGGVSPTLIKIDVEGYELEVLKGAARILEKRPKLDIEVHPFLHADRLAHSMAIFEILGQLDYELFVQPEIDAEIRPLTSTRQVIEALARQQVFHVFGRPSRS
jgi:FkbM family methyltransferase